MARHPSWQRRHEAVLQWFLRYPCGTRTQCASATGYSPTHISRITSTAEFGQRFRSYLSEMEISPRFAEFMIDTSSKDIRWLTWDEAETLEEVPSIHEWVATNCGAMSKNETTTWLMLGAEVDQFNKILSPRDRMLYEQLDNRWRKISSCRSTKIQQARDAIPKPH